MVVALHDVQPASEPALRDLLGILDDLRVWPRTLFVVPHWRRRRLHDCPSLLRLLRREVERGSEIGVHGYSHRVEGPLRGPLPRRLRARAFAPRDAEFLALDLDETRRRLELGRTALREVGLDTDLFCAPGWLHQRELPEALAAEGFRLLADLGRLLNVASAQSRSLCWAGYMGTSQFQERLVALGSRLRSLDPRPQPLHVFLHPHGAPGAAACRAALRRIDNERRRRLLVRYGDLL